MLKIKLFKKNGKVDEFEVNDEFTILEEEMEFYDVLSVFIYYIKENE